MMPGPRAFVLCNGLNGLGAVRSLGSAGIQVDGALSGSGEPAWRSRYLQNRLLTPDDASDAGWLNFLRANARDSVVIPTSDAGVGMLSRLRTHLPADVRVVAPPESVGELLVDKRRELRRMRELSVATPRSVLSLPPTAGALLERLELPIIIKPVLFEDTPIIGAKNLTAASPAELEAAYVRLQGHEDRFIAQEIVPGDDSHLWVCNATFDANSRMIAAFSFQRLRTSPAHYGVTSSAVSTRNERVIEISRAIGSALGYVGPVMFEYKQHPETREYLYIEINPRLGMCNWFDTRCGVNNALAAYGTALGEAPAESWMAQREGVVFLDLFADFYSRLADGEPLLSVARDYAGYVVAPRVGAYFYGADWQPGIAALRRNLRDGLRIGTALIKRKVTGRH